MYSASAIRETISRITTRSSRRWPTGPTSTLDEIYAAVFIDAIAVKVRVLSLIL
jgi:transposase-like protein